MVFLLVDLFRGTTTFIMRWVCKYRIFHGGEETRILCSSEWQQRYRCCHGNIKSIFPRHREMFCLLYGLIYSDTIIHNDDKN